MGRCSRKNPKSKENHKHPITEKSVLKYPPGVWEVLISRYVGTPVSMSTYERYEKIMLEHPKYFF